MWELLVVQQIEMPESLTTQRPDVPPALAALIQRLLSRDPADRPRDAGELLHTLDAMIAAMEPTNVARTKRQVRRRIVALASIVSVMLVGIPTLRALRASHARTLEHGTRNEEAWQAYERGKLLLEDPRQGNSEQALLQFEKAIALDSNFARAWAGLANVYTHQLVFSPEPPIGAGARAEQAVKQALKLDSNLVEANYVRAHLFMLQCRADDAQRAFERTLALDPTDGHPHGTYGLFLHFTGRHDSALAHLHRSRKLGPAGWGAEALLGRVFVNTNQPDSAILYLRNALSFRRDLVFGYEQLAFAWIEKNMKDSAIAAMRQAAAYDRRDSAQLAYIYARAGNRAEALRIVQHFSAESQHPLPEPGMAMAFAALGDINEAFRRLERTPCEVGLRVSAGYESLRSDPRFDDLVRRKGLRLSVKPRDRQ
jgi:Tfp pilus assembly protein PilF